MRSSRTPLPRPRRRSSSAATSSSVPYIPTVASFPFQQAIECSLLSYSLVSTDDDDALRRCRRQADLSLTRYLATVLEAFRSQMPTGVPELGIPPLDPLQFPEDLLVQEDQGFLAQFSATFSGVVVAGVSSFRILRLEVCLQRLELRLALVFPSVRVSGQYELEGHAAGVLPLSGGGNFWVLAEDVEVCGDACLYVIGCDSLQLEALELDLHVGALDLHFDNLLGGGALGEAVNTAASSLSAAVLERAKPRLLSSLGESLKAKLNHELMHVDVAKFIPGGLAHAVGGARQVTDANDYLDHVLDNAREQISQGGLDPLPLPDGELLTNGQLLGLATVYRAGDAAVSFTDKGTTLEARLGFSDVQTRFKWTKKVLFKMSGKVSASARDISVYVKIKQPTSPGSKPLLEGFVIEQLGKVAVEVTGLGPVSWLLEKIATVATNMMRRRLAERLTGPVRDIVEANLGVDGMS